MFLSRSRPRIFQSQKFDHFLRVDHPDRPTRYYKIEKIDQNMVILSSDIQQDSGLKEGCCVDVVVRPPSSAIKPYTIRIIKITGREIHITI